MQHPNSLWEPILHRRLRGYARLEGERRALFLEYLARFLREKRFVAKSRMVIDDDVRVTIAGTAVRLVLDLGMHHLDAVREIVVYPHSVPIKGHAVAGCVLTDGENLAVHLGWQQVLRSLEEPHDGYDVVVHEFAHVLDHEAGSYDGMPKLRASQCYELWAHVLQRHFLEHWSRDASEPIVLRPYAQKNPAEFFAVATEVFFENPDLLQRHLPDLYLKLKRFYGGEIGR